jgi:chromosome segregation ATPase
MESTQVTHFNGSITRSILAVVIAAMVLGIAGCGEETARIESKQIRLEAMAKANAQQLKAVAAVIEQNQQELTSKIEALQKNISNVDVHALAIGEQQVKLQETVQNSTRQLNAKMTAIEQNHSDLVAGIEAVQSDTKKVASDMASVTDEQAKLYAGITAVTDDQARMYQSVQANSRQLADASTAIEQNRQEWQSTMGTVQENIEQVAANMNTLSSDLLKLQDVLQGNIRELVSMMDTSAQGQAGFQVKTREGLQALDDSISAMKETQEKLQTQMNDVQRSTEALGEQVPAAIEQLKDEMSRANAARESAFVDVEPFVSSDSNSME